MVQQKNHLLIVTYPAQGHINPALEFAKRLIRSTGARVTFVTTVYGQRQIIDKSDVQLDHSLTFAPFSDGHDDGFKHDTDDANNERRKQYADEFHRRGSEALSGLIDSSANDGRPITFLIYTLLLTWAAEVAHKFQLPSALLWIQPAMVFDVYYYYFSGYKDLIIDNIEDTSYSVKLPGLPLLKSPDLPSFCHPSNPYAFGIKLFEEQFEVLSREPESFPVLVNSFDELEEEALKAVERFNLIGIGPLIPPACFDSEYSFGGKLDDHSKDYIEWLGSKDNSSVVYASFGSIAVLSSKQMEELARGLVDCGRPFLWVIREHGIMPQVQAKDEQETYAEILRREHMGMIVPWCSQLEVLNHPSVGCFVTHCGWNSTLETLAMGVPVVAFPQWTDQGTNAKLIEDVWKVGVRVRPDEEDKVVKSKEFIRCLEEVMEGATGEEFRSNSLKWKEVTKQAVKEDGSSATNLRNFVDLLTD